MWVVKNRNNAIYLPGSNCTIAGVVYPTCSTTANTNNRRRLFLENNIDGSYYGIITSNEDGGTSNYNGLLLSIQRRAARGVNVGANYTWSHCVGPYSESGVFSHNSSGGTLIPEDRSFDKGNCASDRRQVLNLTSSVATPRFSSATVRAIASDWRLSGIYRISTGDYMTINTGLDRSLSGEIGPQRARQILPDPIADGSSLTYLNVKAFEQPALGTIGNIRPGNILGPSQWQLDFALSRTFQFRESQKFEFRGEAFNVTNSLRRDDPTTTLNSNVFGLITSAKDPRIVQFALKYIF